MPVGFGTGPVVASGRVVLRADNAQLKTELNQAESAFKKTGARLGAVAKTAGLAIGAGLAVGAVGIKKSIDAAIEAEKSQKQMEAALKRVGIAYKDHAKQIDVVIQKQSQLAAVDDEEVQDSFTRLVRVTGNVNQALKANAVALDLARGRNIDLSTAGKVVEKVLNGNTSVLSRYGIKVKEGASATEALGAIQEKYAGSAEAYGNTTAGAYDKSRIAIENVGEKIGSFFLPIAAKLATTFTNEVIPAVGKLVDWLGDKLAPVFDTVKDAVSGVIEFIRKHWPQIRDFIVPIVEAIADRLKVVWDLISGVVKATWEGISKVISQHKETIAKILEGLRTAFRVLGEVVNFVLGRVIKPVLEFVFGEVLPRVINGVITILEKLVDAARFMRDAVVAAFRFMRDAVITAINFILRAVDKFLGGIQAMLEAAGHLPVIGDKFDGLAEKVGNLRENVRSLADRLNNLKDKEVHIAVTWDFTTGPQVGGPTLGGAVGGEGGQDWETPINAMLKAGASKIPVRNLIGSAVAPRKDVISSMWDELGIGQAMGLGVISTYRPGARTVSGGPSAHGVYPSQAIDMSAAPYTGWSNPKMRSYAQVVAGRPGIDEVILGSRIWTASRGWHASSPTLSAQHQDHVHVADYAGIYAGMGGDGYGPVAPPAAGWGPRSAGKGRYLSWDEVAQTVYNAGVRNATKAIRLIAEVGGESGRHSGAQGDSNQSRGLWQIYRPSWPGATDAIAFNPNSAAAYASDIYDRQGPGAWHGNEAPYMSTATDVWNRVKAGPSSSGGGGGGGAPAPAPFTTPAAPTSPTPPGWPGEAEFVALKAIAQKAAAQRSATEKAFFDKFAAWRQANVGWPQWTIQEYRQHRQAAAATQGTTGGTPYTGPPTSAEGKPGDYGTGGTDGSTDGLDGGLDGTDTGGTAGGLSAEELAAQVQAGIRANLNTFLSARSGFQSDFASNIYTPTMGGLTYGSAGPLRNVTVIQQFPRPPDDQFSLLRHVEFAARQVIRR